jgi:hypothetical protein
MKNAKCEFEYTVKSEGHSIRDININEVPMTSGTRDVSIVVRTWLQLMCCALC